MKKKLLFAILTIAVCVFAFGIINASAETYGDLTYKTSGGKVTITDCNENATTVVIPETIEGCPVTSIGISAFKYCSKLTSITIPDSVTSIGDNVFSGCSGLTKVNISSIEAWCNIVFGAFYSNPLYYAEKLYLNNNLITELVIPESVTSINAYAFEYCTMLTSVTIGNSVTHIGDYAFKNCTSLTSITISDSVTNIGDSAFFGCSGLTKVNISSIEAWCNIEFCYSDSNPLYYAQTLYLNDNLITELVIPDGVISVGDYAFSGCTGLTSITLPDSVISMGEGAFSVCTGLTNITIPDSVTSIGDNAFSGCSGLTSITIPDSVTYVGRYAFRHCTGLANITLPDSITSIGDSAFYDCTGLTNITIPDCVTSIGDNAFSGCSGLTSITIPDSVTYVGRYAFRHCTGLANITLPDSITSIGYGAFSKCTGLTDIIIPDSVTSIGDEAFYNCSELASITIGNSVTDIGDSAFFGCKVLTSITIPNNVNSIGYEAFYNCTGLTDIIIPDSVTSIGDEAFYNCSGLTGITLPDSVTYIGDSAFFGCESLTSITIPNSVNSIDDEVFCNCSGLTSIIIPDSVTSIGEGAFSGCSGLTNIIIPDSVTYIGNSAFTKCTNLNSVTIGKGIESVPQGAFYRCDNLRYVCIPKNLKHISDAAFGKDIQKVFYEGSKDEWIKTSFSESNKNLTSAKIIYNSTKRTYRFETNTEEKLTDIIGYAVFEAPEPKNEGKTFVGWYDNPELDDEDISLPYYGENTTLYAKWTDKTGFTFEEAFTARENKVYTVTSNLEQTIYYKFVPKFTGEYRVYSTGSYDTCGYLFDSNQAQLTYDDDDGDSNNFLITYNLTAGETYYIATKVYIGSGTFDLMIETDLSKSKKSVCVTAFTGEKVYITVPANLPEDAKIILSCYKGNTMTDMQVADNSYEAISFVTQAEFDTAKVLTLESFESIKPLCTAEKLVFETNTNPDDDLEFE